MGSVETAGGVARSWRGTGWWGARRGAPPRPDFRKMPRARAPSSVAGWPLHHHPRPPGPPDSSWQPGSPQLPRICCLGLFALPQPEPTVLPLKHRVPGAPQSALCAAETHSVVCVCSARGLCATSSPPLHVPPPHVKVALTSCSPHPVPGRRPRPGSEGSRSRGCGRSEPSRAGWGQPGSLAPCQGARQRLGRGQPLLSVCTGHVQILRRFVEGT